PCQKTMEKINDEYLAILIDNPEFKKELRDQREAAIIEYEALIELNPIASIKYQAMNLSQPKKSANFDIWKFVAAIEKKMGFNINIHQVSAAQFFAYVNL